MSGIVFNTSFEGCRFITDGYEILTDLSSSVISNPDAVLFSGLRQLGNGIGIIPSHCNASSFAPQSVKTLAEKCLKRGLQTLPVNTETITGCTAGVVNRLRKNGNKATEFTFYELPERPDNCAIFLKTDKSSILYVSSEITKSLTVPDFDTLIINTQKKSPLQAILNTIPKFTVEVQDFSKLYEVVQFFSSNAPDNSVGIDNTVTPAACDYLKLNCAVFSKSVKPLSAFDSPPQVIITADSLRYTSLPSVPVSVFLPGMSLADIYSIATSFSTQNVIAVCPDFEGKRKRGNLTICGLNSVFEI